MQPAPDVAGARLRRVEPDGSVREWFIQFKRPDDGFSFLDSLERKCGGPVVDAARNLRWQALMSARVGAEKTRRRRRAK